MMVTTTRTIKATPQASETEMIGKVFSHVEHFKMILG